MKKPHNERKSKKKSKILLTTVGNEIVLSFFFLSLFVLFLNVLSPLMSLFFSIFLIFYDLEGTKTRLGKKEREAQIRSWGNFNYTTAATLVAEQGMYSMALEAIRE